MNHLKFASGGRKGCPMVMYSVYLAAAKRLSTLVEKETTVELVLKDHPMGHKKYGLSRQVVFVDSFNCIEM